MKTSNMLTMFPKSERGWILHQFTLWLLSSVVSQVLSTCRFSQFLQRDEPWVADYGDGRFVAYVKGTYMQINQVKGGSESTYARRCEQKAPDDKYLVTHEEFRKPTKYVCMQFLKRSNNIVQIKISRYSGRRSIDLCDERGMALDYWPIVHLIQTPKQRIPCPFNGGYNVHMYFPNNTMMCADIMFLLRIESECEKGEGITFDFRSVDCIPPTLPRQVKQQAFCIAHWTEGSQSFVVLQHATDHKEIWCLRITDALGDIKGAYLMLDLVCDPSDPITETRNYFYFRMMKNIHASICTDEVEGCEDMPQFCLSDYRRYCAKSCRDCEYESEVGLCTFQEHLRGSWIDSSKGGDKKVKVYDYSMVIQDVGRFQCLEMESEKFKTSRVLLELFDNGCYPRYACVHLEKIAPNVMTYRLGNRIHWPLPYLSDQKEYICGHKNFRPDGENRFFDELPPPKLLISTGKIHPINCGLPAYLQYGLSFKEDGKECGGCLYYNPHIDGDRLTVQPVNCSSSKVPIKYSCLASFDFGNNTHAVVTKRDEDQYVCWVFTTDGKIKVLKAADCLSFENFESDDLEVQFLVVEATSVPEINLCRNLIERPRTTTTAPSPQRTTTVRRINYSIPHPNLTEFEVKTEDKEEGIITPKSSVALNEGVSSKLNLSLCTFLCLTFINYLRTALNSCD